MYINHNRKLKQIIFNRILCYIKTYYLPPARPGNLKNSLYFVFTGFSGFVQLHVKLTQLSEIQEKFVMGNGLSIKKNI